MGRSADDRRAAGRRGAEAETRVAAALEGAGWTVVARNWRCENGELDVVVRKAGRDGDRLRIVEVKYRAPDDPVGVEVVEGRKRLRLARAAEAFLAGWPDPVAEVCMTVALVEESGITWWDDAFDSPA